MNNSANRGGADNVNHPNHYEKSCSLECIEVMYLVFGKKAVFNFCLCNSFKYMWRYKNKNGEEDLNKAEWYLNHVHNSICGISASKRDVVEKEAMEKCLELERLLFSLKHKSRGEKVED